MHTFIKEPVCDSVDDDNAQVIDANGGIIKPLKGILRDPHCKFYL